MIKTVPAKGRVSDIVQILLTTDQEDLEIGRKKLNVTEVEQARYLANLESSVLIEENGEAFAILGIFNPSPFVNEYFLIVDGTRYSRTSKAIIKIIKTMREHMRTLKGRVQMSVYKLGKHADRSKRFIEKRMGLEYEATLKNYFLGEHDVDIYVLGEQNGR